MLFKKIKDIKIIRRREIIRKSLDEYIKNNYIENRLEAKAKASKSAKFDVGDDRILAPMPMAAPQMQCCSEEAFDEIHENALEERMKHLTDTFSEYLLYLIESRGMENADVWKNALVDKKVFSKIKNNPTYHPNKLTAMCLCIGARLNIDETRDLLARAGYALSPCEKTDIIFSYFIENEIYDMIEIDIQLEEHGLPCIIA